MSVCYCILIKHNFFLKHKNDPDYLCFKLTRINITNIDISHISYFLVHKYAFFSIFFFF